MITGNALTRKQIKEQEKIRKYNEKMRKKNGSEAVDLYKMQKKIKKTVTFNKILLWIFLFIVFLFIGLFLGFLFTVDRFNFFDIFGKMFESFGLPNLIEALFK